MTNQPQNPLVTIIVVTYNQEKVVEEAVRSAFRQDYNPLEIILSDDCSTDSTHSLLKKMASEYKGPHQVKVNKNINNLGIGKHWDTISRLAKGELIVHAAGDDVSVPDRVSILVKAWMSVDPRPTLISSDGIITSFEGEPIRRHIGTRWPEKIQIQNKPRFFDLDVIDVPVCGFSLAIDRHLYEIFKPIQERMWAEDEILRRRSLLLNGIMYIPDVLVYYRDQGLSKGAKKNQHAYLELFNAQAKSRLAMIRQSINDIKVISPHEINYYYNRLQLQEFSALRRLQLVRTGILSSLPIIFRQLTSKSEFGILKSEYLNYYFVKFSPKIFFLLRSAKYKIKNLFQKI